MDYGIHVTLDTGGLDALSAAFGSAAGTSPAPAIRDMYKAWTGRTATFNLQRFERNSRGGGDWPPLALSTIARRTKSPGRTPRQKFGGGRNFDGDGGLGRGARSSLARDTARGVIVAYPGNPGGFVKLSPLTRSGRTVSILRDTGALMNALKIGQPGNLSAPIAGGIVYGIDGPAAHSNGKPVVVNFLARVGAAIGTPAKASKAGRGKGGARGGGSGGVARTVAARAKGGGVARMVTIADIAAFHQNGGSYLPQRKVVVVPDQEVIDQMAGDAIEAIGKLGLSASRGGTVSG